MLALLERLVNIDSGSGDKAGVDAVGDEIVTFLEQHGVLIERIGLEQHGDALRANVSSGEGNRPIMLLGHRDTVFSQGRGRAAPVPH